MKKLILILALILNLNSAGAYECNIYYPADWLSPTDIKQIEGRIQVLFATPGRISVLYQFPTYGDGLLLERVQMVPSTELMKKQTCTMKCTGYKL